MLLRRHFCPIEQKCLRSLFRLMEELICYAVFMRIIAHLDMDAFFAAVEEMDNPRFKGLPIVVGADPEGGAGRGVVSTANYKAREYGIRSALPIARAWRYSEDARRSGMPPAVFLPPNFKRYAEISARIMTIIRRHASVVEEASIDEAYFDLSHLGFFDAAAETAFAIKNELETTEYLTASVGIGPNKLIAKIASDRQKPDGLTMVTEQEAERFLEPLAIRTLPGVGPKTEARFTKLGVRTVGDAKRFSEGQLEEYFGRWGRYLFQKLRGVSESPVTEAYEVKSIGEQETFRQDTLDTGTVISALERMCGHVAAQVARDGFLRFRTVVLIARFADYTTKTRSHTLKNSVISFEALRFEALKLLMPFFDRRENPRRMPLRLIGIRVEKLQ